MRHRSKDDGSLWESALAEHANAVDEYCDAVQAVAIRLGNGEEPSPEELTREQSAHLRLQNARALLAFGVGIRAPESEPSLPKVQQAFRTAASKFAKRVVPFSARPSRSNRRKKSAQVLHPTFARNR